jgi:L-alanine-DL-glutamate epimerase-like enolase superfamily enzyme
MRRRSFLAAAAALGGMPMISPTVQAAAKSANLKITDVEIWRLTGNPDQIKAYQASFGHGTTRNLRNLPASQLYMKILTNEGVEGFYGSFDQTAANAVMGMAREVIGQDPLAIDTIWETMHAGAHRYSGTYVFGLSTIDNCLWDLKGKFLDLPVYRLLGGSRKTFDVYASCIGQSLEPDRVRESAAQLKKEGYKSQKWFPTRGPSDGQMGYEENLALIRILRETVGENYEIMIDTLLRWNLPYAMKWCKDAEQFRPRWLEEPVPTAGQVESLARLRQMTFIPIATGEHSYGRWDAQELIEHHAVDVIQIDPEWGGGISELVKICTLASVHGLIVCPHNQRSTALAHIIASQPPAVCPFMEYQIDIQPNLYYFDKNQLIPKDNQITLPDLPGLGIELDESRIVKREKIFPVA